VTHPVTYRELLDDAARALTGLHTLASVAFRDPADALDTASAWRRLVHAGVRHAALLAPNDPLIAAMPRLRPARRPARPRGDGPLHPAGQALVRSGESLALAHDVLASHLGPERQHRTADAALIESAGPRSAAVRDLSSMLLTTAVAHQTLARRSLDLYRDPTRVPPPVTRILDEGVALLGPAAQLDDQARTVREPGPDALGALTSATPLTAADPAADPAAQAAAALLRLRVAAHRQAVGDLGAGAATMRAFAAVAITMIRRDLETTPLSRTRGPRPALMSAGRSWARLHAAWGEVATLGGGPRAVLHDAATAVRLLEDGRRPAGWGTAAPGPGTRDWLSQVAASLVDATLRVAHEGPILVPTRWCEGADVPRPWAPALPEHVQRLTDLHRAVVRDSALQHLRPSWATTRAGVTADLSPAPALARTS
jgi:hypothetical protein